MVAQDRDDGELFAVEQRGEHPGLVSHAAVGQIAREEEQVGFLPDKVEQLPQLCFRALPGVNVANRRQSNHSALRLRVPGTAFVTRPPACCRNRTTTAVRDLHLHAQPGNVAGEDGGIGMQMSMQHDLPAEVQAIYTRAMQTLQDAGVPYLVAGALAVYHYTGLWRNTKDLDLFLRPEDRDPALVALANAGFRVEILASHWLAKAVDDDVVVDLISGFGNWLQPVDDSWFEASEPLRIFGLDTSVLAITDLIWAKSYVAGRERFDGADIAHLIRRAHDRINWQHLLDRYADHWELLSVYIHYYRFVYPEARSLVPTWVVEYLIARLQDDLRTPARPEVPFRGPLLDRFSYLVDIDHWGESDPREDVARRRDLPPEEVIEQRAADQALVDQDRVHGKRFRDT